MTIEKEISASHCTKLGLSELYFYFYNRTRAGPKNYDPDVSGHVFEIKPVRFEPVENRTSWKTSF